MADIELVIKIDENIYNHIKERYMYSYATDNTTELNKVGFAVRNGIQLPKGHGDLIDRRELKKEVYTTTEWNGDVHRIIYEASIDDANPIIEADKGE